MLFTNRVMTFMMPCMTFIMYGLTVLIVWVAAHKIDNGSMQVGAMTAFIYVCNADCYVLLNADDDVCYASESGSCGRQN